MGARACLHDGRQLLGISVNMVATEQRVLNSKLSVADIICQDAGAAKCVRAGWFGVGCDRDDPSFAEGVFANVQRGRYVRRYAWRPRLGFVGDKGFTVEPSERGAGTDESISGIILWALEVFARSEGEGVAGDEDGFLQSTLCRVIVGPINVVERPHDEWYRERNASLCAVRVPLGVVAY